MKEKGMTYGELAEWAKSMPEDEIAEIDLFAEDEKQNKIRYTTMNIIRMKRVLSETETIGLLQTKREHFDPWLSDILAVLSRLASGDQCRDIAQYFIDIAEEFEEF